MWTEAFGQSSKLNVIGSEGILGLYGMGGMTTEKNGVFLMLVSISIGGSSNCDSYYKGGVVHHLLMFTWASNY